MLASGLARQLSLMLTCALLTLALPLPATAQNGLSLDPTQGPPGTEVRVSGDGFSPDAELVIWFAGVGEVGQATADGTGAFSTTFTVPPAATVGGHAVSVETPGMSGAAVATFEVTGPPAGEQQQASIALDPTEGPRETEVTVTGNGFTANDTVFLFFAISGNEVAQTTADSTGAFETTFTVPSDATAGDNKVIAGEVDPTYLADAIFRVTGEAGPSPGEGPQPAEGAIPIDSTKAGWQQTQLSLAEGQQFTISYGSGTWTVDHRNFPYVGPDGYDGATDSRIYQGCKLDASLPYGRLLGKVGEGQFFSVGKGGDFTANGTGILSLKIHDHDNCLVDNAGAIGFERGTLSLGGVEAPVEPIEEAFNFCRDGIVKSAKDDAKDAAISASLDTLIPPGGKILGVFKGAESAVKIRYQLENGQVENATFELGRVVGTVLQRIEGFKLTGIIGNAALYCVQAGFFLTGKAGQAVGEQLKIIFGKKPGKG